jgi:glucokinase
MGLTRVYATFSANTLQLSTPTWAPSILSRTASAGSGSQFRTDVENLKLLQVREEDMNYLAIEIGGTKLQLGIGPGDGTLKGLWRGNVDAAAGADGIRRKITEAVPELLSNAGLSLSDLHGAGIGFGGPVDDATQTVIRSHQIQGWDGFPLADWISDLVGLQAALGNDADCAGLAEALFGAGKGLSPIFYITIGSGIGGGLIINGEIYRGCGRGAAEIGHVRVAGRDTRPNYEVIDLDLELREADGGPKGYALEQIASGWSIELEAHRILGTATLRQSTLRTSAEKVTAAHVAQAAAQGNSSANSVLNRAWDRLADAIVEVITLLSPRRIVIGGGVSLMGEKLLFEPLRSMVARRVFEPFRGSYDIIPAALGEEVVVHGALVLARRRFTQH